METSLCCHHEPLLRKYLSKMAVPIKRLCHRQCFSLAASDESSGWPLPVHQPPLVLVWESRKSVHRILEDQDEQDKDSRFPGRRWPKDSWSLAGNLLVRQLRNLCIGGPCEQRAWPWARPSISPIRLVFPSAPTFLLSLQVLPTIIDFSSPANKIMKENSWLNVALS